MSSIHKRVYSVIFFALVSSLSINAQITVKKPTKPLIVQPGTPGNMRLPYDLKVSLDVELLDGDRCRLTAEVKNIGKYGYSGGGALVLGRAGHGEPLPARFGDRVDRTIKWGHKRLNSWVLPAIKTGESVTRTFATMGLGDFYAHLEKLTFDTNSANDRSEVSNLRVVSNDVDSNLINGWFFPYVGQPVVARSRLHGHRGNIEIPGLIPLTTFALPRTVLDAYRTGLRVLIAINAHDINLSQSRVFLGHKYPFSSETSESDPATWLWTEVTWELNGVEFKMGDDMFIKALYPDVHYLERITGAFNPFTFRIGFRLTFDERAQLFRLNESESWIRNFNGGISIDGQEVTDRAGLHEMFAPTAPQIRDKMAAAITAKRAEIEWLFNKRMREIYLIDRYGNTGAIDSVSFDGGRFSWKLRAPSPNQ